MPTPIFFKKMKKKAILNLTPHAIILLEDSMRTEIPSTGVARLEEELTKVNEYTTLVEYTNVVGLPEPQPDTIYIVSCLVAQHCRERDDLRFPGQMVRDDQGRIVGCKSLNKFRDFN